MNYAALWHEATQRYCYCLEPGRFLFRLQTAKDDLKSVTLHTLDKYLPLKIKDTRKATPMKWVANDGLRDYYEVELEFRVVCLRYCLSWKTTRVTGSSSQTADLQTPSLMI